jgi:chemotaxis protein methyltransferase CheR
MPAAAVLATCSVDRLSDRNFQRLVVFISERAGIKMPPSKRTMLEGRLRRRLRATGAGSLDGYCDFLFKENGLQDEAPYLINAVTTNKTDFFREPKHFDYLERIILPELKASGSPRIRVWSAACSTGAEPYTIAMMLDDFAERHDGPGYGILATDLDTDVLETARRGIYPAAMVEPVPDAFLRRYIRWPKVRSRNEVRIAPALRAAVGFAQLNLMDSHYPVGAPMDLIFCRNVLIYFDKPTQKAVVSRLCRVLRPGGWLLLGHSESIAGFGLPLEAVATTVFRRR